MLCLAADCIYPRHSLKCWMMPRSLPIVFWYSSSAESQTTGHNGAPTIRVRLIGCSHARTNAKPASYQMLQEWRA